jgi:hypothetical protein
MAILEIDFLRAHRLSVGGSSAGKLVQAGTGLFLSTISSFNGATASATGPGLAINPPAVRVPDGQVASAVSTLSCSRLW